MNPFKRSGYILPIASINSMYIDDTTAFDMFRPALILDDIIKNKDELGLSNYTDSGKLLLEFNNLLKSDLDSIKIKATEIAEIYGDRLGKVLSTLYKPSLKSVLNRENWTDEHWDYWKSITHIYLVGGMTSPILTTIFYDRVSRIFEEKKIDNVTITFIEGSSNLGTKGLASIVEDGDYLLFDFGQTNIKRARHYKQHGEVIIDTVLPMVQSDFLFYKSKNEQEVKEIAHKLDDYIVEVICNTLKQVAYKGNKIHMSIANYIYEGKIYAARGGYGKLSYIADDYQAYLAKRLSKIYNKDIELKLYHDTSAMALIYRNKPNTAVISLGTAFGIAFPE